MANDPNRDLLPVKDIDDRSTRGAYCRADRNVVAKLKRCDLEDRYMRLYDENTQLKKQLNCQEEKIKRLGTKLLRLIAEKKNCPDSNRRRHESKGLEELRMRIIELQHENYTLKDRNVVLKQQLASHARQHVAAHRSPNRSLHTSPRISNRQSSAPNVNDGNYILSNRNPAQDVQLREAEEHIHGLNKEIKSLHNKIDILQQDLEKSCLETQKTKVCENIELIRLQRSLKQQSIQIASLQAHIKSSEKCQKLLRDELAAAHRENEESLQVISEKQKEILDLYTKLEESKVIRLEQEEMKERINDLTSERDSLRERGEFLMKTIEVKSSEGDIVNELKKLLAVEKAKKEELKQSLENTQKVLQSLKDSAKKIQSQSSLSDGDISRKSSAEDIGKTLPVMLTTGTQTTFETTKPVLRIKTQEEELELLTATQLVSSSDGRSRGGITGKELKTAMNMKENGKSCNMKSVATSTEDVSICGCGKVNSTTVATQTQECDLPAEHEPEGESSEPRRTLEAEKINVERELEYVKQMLRSQTERCAAQDEEINQLKNDLRVSEEKYNDTLRRLDLHLKIFRHLDSRSGRNVEVDSDVIEQRYLSLLTTFEEDTARERYPRRSAEDEDQGIEAEEKGNKKMSNSGPSGSDINKTDKPDTSPVEHDGKLRFLRRKYLDSSDEDDDDDDEDDLIKKEEILVRGPEDKSKKYGFKKSSFLRKPKQNGKFGSDSSDSVQPSESPSKTKRNEMVRPIPKPRTEIPKPVAETSGIGKTDNQSPKSLRGPKPGKNISICIEWLKLEPETSLWYDESVKLLFIDFRFLDVKGEETETPSSLKKPKKSAEKCYFNFTKNIDINDFRLNALLSVRGRPDDDLISFKIVSEPDESSDEDECVDVGVAVITVKQFMESNSNTSLLLPVKNAVDVKEKIGILSVKLNISAISEYFK